MGTPAVVFGGPSSEHDVSILTGLQVARSLLAGGVECQAIYWAKNTGWFSVAPDLEAADFIEGPPRGARPLRLVAGPDGGFFAKRRLLEISVVVNCCHGGPGEDGTLQGTLDLCGIRHAGPTVAGAAIGMDKLAFGASLAAAGLPTLPRLLVEPGIEADPPDFPGPYIVKPRYGGSSIGIEIVDDPATARALVDTSVHMRDGAVIEPYLADSRDLNVAIRTHPELQLSAIEAPVRARDAGSIYTYAEKYLSGDGLAGAPRELPADLPADLAGELRRLAREVAVVAGVRSMARLDFLLSDGGLVVNEINTIPGSLSTYLWVDPPLTRFELVTDLIAEAESAPARRFSSAGADGSVLQSAESIARKLGG